MIDPIRAGHYKGMQNAIDRNALFASFSGISSDNLPSREKLEAASEEEVQELADFLAAGDGPRTPKLMERRASF